MMSGAGTTSIVELEDVSKIYRQGAQHVEALRGLTMSVTSGEFTAISGPSGSGKTTALNLIGALDTPTSGTVRLEGTDLGSLNRKELSRLRRDRIGFVFQAYNLLPVLSAYENAEFVLMLQGVPESDRKERVMATLKAVGLEGMENRRPNELSGGQQQRVAVARAIAGQPALVLADEPTANLDSKTGTELVALMKKLNEEQGITFVFATHDPNVMKAARRLVRLVDGRIDTNEVRA